jgi:triacylglycerol lipase
MPTLTPLQSANIALGVYELRTKKVADLSGTGKLLGSEGMFAVGDSNTFKGESGVALWKEITGFGYVAAGVAAHEGESIIVCRGTDIVQDWLTDANFGATSGPSGSSVHAGFMNTWSSFSHEIDAFFARKKTTTIHCVGHSLGGALATLAAAHCVQRGYGKPEIYTFGSPRVGFRDFASDLTSKVGAYRIHRVSHAADPVPMVPLWPFTHVPLGSDGMILGGDKNTIISFGAHSMSDNYRTSMGKNTWASLSSSTVSRSAGERAEDWLNGVSRGTTIVTPMGVYSFGMITRALRWIVDGATDLINVALGPVSMGAVTLLDYLAILVEKAVQVAEKMAHYVKALIKAIFKFIGYTANTTVELTKKFIGWALRLLFAPIRMMAKAATDSLKGG